MIKALWTALAAVVICVVAYAVNYAFTPESEKIRKQYISHLQSRDEIKFPKDHVYRTMYQKKATDFQMSLALAYNREKKPDDAILIIEELIKQNRDTHYKLFGRVMPRGSWVYGFDAHYYEMLANAFDLKKDNNSRDKALMNKNHALSEGQRLSSIENSHGK